MSKKGRKLTKEELEQDPLLNFYQRVQQFYQQYKTHIFSGLAAIVILMAGSVIYYNKMQKQEAKAQQLLGFAEGHFRNGEYTKALTGKNSQFTIGLESIMKRYSGTNSANLAHYYASISEFKLGNTEKALEYIQDYNPPEGILGVGPIAYKAMLFNDLGHYQKAAETYERAARWNENESTTPYNLYKAASSYFEAGEYSAARKLVDRILNEYPQSTPAADAQKLKGRLVTATASASK